METRLLIGGELVAGNGPPLAVEDPAREETHRRRSARPTPEQLDAAIEAARARPARVGRHAGRRARRGAARGRRADARPHRRAGRADDARGRQAADREPRRGRLDGERVRLLRRARAHVGGPRDPAGRVLAARARAQGAARRSSPASCRGTTRCCCSPGSSRRCWPPATPRSASRPSSRRCRRSRWRRASTTCRPALVALLAGGGDVGERLVDDERVDGIAFTGSVATGTRIAERAARRIARVNLELGGKDPFIVCADVAGEIEIAARGGAWAAFLNAGQVCTSAERFYVQREVYDDFLNAFVDHTRTLRDRRPDGPGDRRRPDGQRRPARQGARAGRGGGGGRRRAARRRRRRRARARLLLRARRGHRRAARRPTCCARRRSARSRRSCRSTSLDEAIELANASPYGLGANVYTRDLETAIRCARELRAGTVWINDPLTDNDAGPFGGMKRSGPRPRARPGGARRLPGDQARPHRDQARGQGLVVSVRLITSGASGTL